MASGAVLINSSKKLIPMIKKLSTIHLLGILAVLILVFLALEYFGNQSRSSSFKETLVEIDTLNASRMVITKGTEDPFELNRSGDGWELTLTNNKNVRAMKSSVKSSMASLQSIKPARIVANQEDRWAEYQVDTAGTRVEIFEGETKSLDLLIGRFGVKGQREFYTYVRLFEENEVYAADGFMGISFGSEPGSYRFKEILRFVKDSLDQFSFNYPGDSSFMMIRSEQKNWIIEGLESDSASTQTFINGVRFLSGTEFVDDLIRSDLGDPSYSVLLRRRGSDDLRIEAFSDPTHNWIINSNHNPDSWFADPDRILINKLFPGRAQLLGDLTSE